MPQPELSVVIPVRNGVPLIAEELDALTAQADAPPFEVIVSDNGSSDGTADLVRGWSDRLDLKVVDSSQAPGVSHARNRGAAEASAPLVAFCDADDMVSSRWVRGMVDGLRTHDIVGGPLDVRSLNQGNSHETAGAVEGAALPSSMGYLPYAFGGNLGCRLNVLRELDGFDTSFVGGHEEVDFCWRAQRQGYTIGLAPEAVLAYRMRDSDWSLYRRHRGSGRTYAQLYARHRGDADISRSNLRDEARAWLRLLRLMPELLHSASRKTWLTHAGWMTGRLQGWARYRVRPPL